MTHTSEQIEAQYQKLPEAVKDALYAVETANTVMAIGKKHGLHVDQIGKLAEEIGLLMIGLETPEQFVSSLVSVLRVTQTLAVSIAQDVNEQIMLKVQNLMRQENVEKMPTRDDLIREIENPKPLATNDIFAAKMSQMFSLPRTETTATPEPPTAKPLDPYHEPIE